MPGYSLPPPETHEIPGLGSVSIRHLSMGDAIKIEEAAGDRPDDYANQVFAAIVVEPPLTVDAASQLDESTVSALVEVAAERLGIKHELAGVSRDLPARRRLYEAERARWAAIAEQMKPVAEEARKRFAEMAASFQPLREQMAKQLAAVNTVLSSEATRSIVKSLQMMSSSLAAVKLPPIKNLSVPPAALKIATFPQIDKVIGSMAIAKLPSWVLDDSLIRSGINTPIIHTPTYVPRSPATDRAPSQSELNRRRLLDAFDALLKFENAARDVIARQLAATSSGSKWWKQRVPKDVIDNCEKRKQEKEKSGGISHDAIHYAYPDDYLKIITRNDNWNECFQIIFGTKNGVISCFYWIGVARPEIAHVRPLKNADYANFMFAVSWVIRAIKGEAAGS